MKIYINAIFDFNNLIHLFVVPFARFIFLSQISSLDTKIVSQIYLHPMCHQIKDARMKIPPINHYLTLEVIISINIHKYNTRNYMKKIQQMNQDDQRERFKEECLYLFFPSRYQKLSSSPPLISRIRLPWSGYASFASRNIDFRFSTVAWLRLTFQFLRESRPAASSIECAWIIDHAPTRKREKGARKAFRRSNSREAAKYRTRSSIPRHRFHFVPSVQRPFHPLARD